MNNNEGLGPIWLAIRAVLDEFDVAPQSEGAAADGKANQMDSSPNMNRFCRSLAVIVGVCILLLPIGAEAQVRNSTGAFDQQSIGGVTSTSTGNARQDASQQQSAASNTSTPGLQPGESVTNYQPDDLTLGQMRGDKSEKNDKGDSRAYGVFDRTDRVGRTYVKPDKPSEFELFVSNLAGHKVRRFGAELLVPESRDFTSPPTTAVPSDYRINPGDELVVGLTGSVQATNLRLVVDQDGRIFIPKVGPVRVGGVPYRDLQGAIASQVARQYREFRVAVSIGALHGITVYVTGFAAVPGSYTMSSLSTVVNAVLAAGGPAAGGSFRSVQVRRSGRLVSDFDLYDFLLKGEKEGDIVIQNGDVITIAPSGAQVAAIGSLNREAIYEARAGDTLADILRYAGGANTVADLSRLHVLDPKADNGWQELTPEVALSRGAERGNVLRVLSAVGMAQPSQRLQSLVTVSGEVQKPGRYFVKPGTTLDEVVAMAGGLTPQAYPFGAVFIRDSLRRQQQINFEKAINETRISLTAAPLVMASAKETDLAFRLATVNALVDQLRAKRIDGRLVFGESGASQFTGTFVVENNDELYIPPQSLAVGVYGMVNSSADFRYQPGLMIRDYLNMAGDYSKFADKSHLFVIRANGSVLAGRSARGAHALPGDLIFVPVDSERGQFWTRLRDLVSFGMQGTLTAAAVASAIK